MYSLFMHSSIIVLCCSLNQFFTGNCHHDQNEMKGETLKKAKCTYVLKAKPNQLKLDTNAPE